MLRHREIRTVDGDGEPVVIESGTRRARSSFLVTPAQILSAIGGLVLIAFGVFAVVRAGLSSPLSDPQVQVLGLQHTAAIGLLELAVGAVLVLCALSPATRALSALIGIALVVAGIVLLAGSDQLLADLHTEAALGWLGVIVGGFVLLSALVVPRRTAAV
ncbi:MAG TPA: hypothetical protein VF076_06260 [Acidimicrobiales bacterium]